ncbi:MAG: DNA repair protein RecO [Candidatus Omnitrophica bacterium]|nr:DNA repair protein RecO [Candidatus Omnitrophota bacterium]
MIEKTRGYITKRKIYRDTSLLLTIYSYDYGKIEGIAKGARKIDDYGRYDGILDLFSEYEVVFYPRRQRLALFVQFYQLDSFWEHIRDYEKFVTICTAMELLNYIAQPYEQNHQIYNLLEFFLKEVAVEKTDIIFCAFVIKLLKFSGFSPQIDECLKCKNKIDYHGGFSVSEGSLFCLKCGGGKPGLIPVSSGTIKSINFLKEESYSNIKRFELAPKIKSELEGIIAQFMHYQISFLPRLWQELNVQSA